MIFAIVLMIVMVLIGIAGIAVGIYELVEYNDGILGIFSGAILLFLSIVCIIAIVDDNTETTEKVVGKGTIVTEVDFNYFNDGEDNSNEIKYFIEVESGDKIILDKSEWDSIKDEYTYIPSRVNVIRGDDE